jgi:hypothetical protein
MLPTMFATHRPIGDPLYALGWENNRPVGKLDFDYSLLDDEHNSETWIPLSQAASALT